LNALIVTVPEVVTPPATTLKKDVIVRYPAGEVPSLVALIRWRMDYAVRLSGKDQIWMCFIDDGGARHIYLFDPPKLIPFSWLLKDEPEC